MTIDFVCLKQRTDDGIHTYELNSFSPEFKEPVPFTSPIVNCENTFKTSLDIHGKIVEFLYDVPKNQWTLVRVRTDKGENAKGNALRTARNLLANMLYNITFEMLCNGIPNCYFEFKRSESYAQMTSFINKVK